MVERTYALQHPDDFKRMVDQWSHTATQKQRYTASSYVAGTLGRMSAAGLIAYHTGRGSERWSYNTDISHPSRCQRVSGTHTPPGSTSSATPNQRHSNRTRNAEAMCPERDRVA